MKRVLSIILCIIVAALSFSACSGEKTEEAQSTERKFTVDAAYLSYDSSTISAYETLCGAVMKGESFARFNVGLTEKVRRLFYTSFPLNVFVDGFNIKEDKSGVDIAYNVSAEELAENIYAFQQKIDSIKSACAATNKNAYAVNVYAYVAKSIKVSEDVTISCYDTIMKDEGTANSYSQMLSYLLREGGINAAYVTAVDARSAGWGLCQANIKDNWYYLDPMTEFYDNQGERLLYFGMTEKDINAEGLSSPTYSDSTATQDASSLDFDACRICKNYEIKDNNLVILTTEGNIVQIAL